MTTLEYKWEQNFEHITISIIIEENTNKKDINIEILPKYLKIKVKDKILEGELYKRICVDESSWYLINEDNVKKLIIELAQEYTKDFEGLTPKCFIFEESIYGDRKDFKVPKRKLNECSKEFQMRMMKKFHDALSKK